MKNWLQNCKIASAKKYEDTRGEFGPTYSKRGIVHETVMLHSFDTHPCSSWNILIHFTAPQVDEDKFHIFLELLPSNYDKRFFPEPEKIENFSLSQRLLKMKQKGFVPPSAAGTRFGYE